VTISIGATQKKLDKENTMKNLLETADEALYKAKRSGRNKVICN
jgi:diguanylate cyclase (GGDEF)-like protein